MRLMGWPQALQDLMSSLAWALYYVPPKLWWEFWKPEEIDSCFPTPQSPIMLYTSTDIYDKLLKVYTTFGVFPPYI